MPAIRRRLRKSCWWLSPQSERHPRLRVLPIFRRRPVSPDSQYSRERKVERPRHIPNLRLHQLDASVLLHLLRPHSWLELRIRICLQCSWKVGRFHPEAIQRPFQQEGGIDRSGCITTGQLKEASGHGCNKEKLARSS